MPSLSERDARICELYMAANEWGDPFSYSEIAEKVGLDRKRGRNVVAGVIRRNRLANRGGQGKSLPPLVLLRGAAVAVGDVYGYPTVTESVGKDKSGNVQVRCLCRCGRSKIVHAGNLRSGQSRGCYHRGAE